MASKRKRGTNETSMHVFKPQSILEVIADLEMFLCGYCSNTRSTSSFSTSSKSSSGTSSDSSSSSNSNESSGSAALVALEDDDDTFRRAVDMLVYIISSMDDDSSDPSLRARILQRCSALVLRVLKCMVSLPPTSSNSKQGNSLLFIDGFSRDDRNNWIAYGIRSLVTVLNSCLGVYQQQGGQQMVSTIVAATICLLDDFFLLDHVNIYSVAAQLTSNDQDMVSFCCTLLKLQLRLEHIEASIPEIEIEPETSRAQLLLLRETADRALAVMTDRGFKDMPVFMVFVESAASFDASVLLDLLSSSETVALEYLLRMSKRLLSENRESLEKNLAYLDQLRSGYLSSRQLLTDINRSDDMKAGCGGTTKVVIWLKREESVPVDGSDAEFENTTGVKGSALNGSNSGSSGSSSSCSSSSGSSSSGSSSSCSSSSSSSSSSGGGSGVDRVSRYEWDRDASLMTKQAITSTTVAATDYQVRVSPVSVGVNKWVRFLADVAGTLSSTSTRRSLPFDPTLLVKRLQIVLQNLGN